jgi:hypothetical protein
MMHSRLLAKSKYRNVEFSAVLAAALIMSACSSVPQQVYHQTNIDSEHAIIVIGVAQEGLPPRVRFGIILDGRSFETQKVSSTPFLYESGSGPPESATAKYFVYRVPAGIYTVELGALPLPIVRTVGAPGGQAVYIGDFPLVANPTESDPRGDLPAAQKAVAALLPSGLSLVKAD